MTPTLLLILLTSGAVAGVAQLTLGRSWRQLPIFVGVALAACVLLTVFGVRLTDRLPQPAGVPLLESALLGWTLAFVAARLRL